MLATSFVSFVYCFEFRNCLNIIHLNLSFQNLMNFDHLKAKSFVALHS